jgi:glyoxylase-like metal-dependent hydrolase (beta-lactamase superfamily II)
VRIRLVSFPLVALVAACTPEFPVRCGEALTYSRCETPILSDASGYRDTLQVRWLGTTVHFIQLGPLAVMTDPYFSHFRPSKVFFGKIHSDVSRVARMTRDLPTPDAIFVGHAHYDHMLDLPEVIRQRGWSDVPIYGGPSMRHILAGYGEGLERRCRLPVESGEWTPIAEGLS